MEEKNSVVIDEIDNEMFETNGVRPQEENMGKRFKETQEYIKKAFGGGEDNELDIKYIDGLRERKEAIEHRLLDQLDGAEVEEIEEVEEIIDDPTTFEVPEPIEVLEVLKIVSREELLMSDGIIFKK